MFLLLSRMDAILCQELTSTKLEIIHMGHTTPPIANGFDIQLTVWTNQDLLN